jgi:penicillin-binding protein 1A
MAMIAGLPKAPSKYNPVVNPERALERRNWILGRMLQLGYINQSQYQKALLNQLTLICLTVEAIDFPTSVKWFVRTG